MASSRERVVNDNIHGDIPLRDEEWRVVNTGTFQRLRSLKQLGMAHLVYPNATHTRFAHSLGVFRIMCRVLGNLTDSNLTEEQRSELRLAALLHDLGHYPYSHLMERIDDVVLMESDVVREGVQTISGATGKYPEHEELGRHILENQEDIREAVGGEERAKKIGALFSRLVTTDQQLSKLVHSSLDMDRLDYLLRDARATGVPYGEIDLDYLLNKTRISPKGVVGVDVKALAAAEHFLLARMFMHRVVYYHKTTYGLEEMCRQLLRRVRDCGRYSGDLVSSGQAVFDLVGGTELRRFTDDYVDRVIAAAASDSVPIIKLLADSLLKRSPPKLLVEISGIEQQCDGAVTLRDYFRQLCREKLEGLAKKHKIELGQFLLCGPKPIKFEERGSLFSREAASKLKSEEREEIIKVFPRGQEEPRSIVDIEGSLIRNLSNQVFAIQRLYLVQGRLSDADVESIHQEVQKWAIRPR
jgi:uncharacterized protein